MNLNDIAANFKAFPLLDPESYNGDYLLNDMLGALFYDVVRPRSEQFVPDLMEVSRIALHVVVGSYYGGMHILVIDDQPVALFTKSTGDREDSQTPYVLNLEVFARVASELAVAETKLRITNVEAAGETLVRKLDSPFLRFLGQQATMFAVKSPDEVYLFSDILNEHRGYFVSSTGAVTQLESIGAVTGEDMATVTLVGGEQVLVDASQLMFELQRGQGNIEDALTAYASDPHWVLKDAMRHGLMVSILMQRPYFWSSKLVLIEFETEDEYDRFCSTYPVGVKDEHLQRGVFSIDELGFKVRRVHA